MAIRPPEFGSAGRNIRLYVRSTLLTNLSRKHNLITNNCFQTNAFDVSYPDARIANQPILHYDIDFIIPPRSAGEAGKQKKMNRTQAWELWQELGPSNPDIAHMFEAAVRPTHRVSTCALLG